MDKNLMSKTALILIDPYNEFLSEGGKLWRFTKETVEGVNLIKNLKLLIDTARINNIQVVYAPHRQTAEGDYLNWKFKNATHSGSEKHMLFSKGTFGGEFHPDLQPQKDDLIAQSHWTSSGFANTDLDFILRIRGIEHVIIAGMRANTCIDSTARYAVELGYHVTLIRDGIAAFSWEEIKATVDLNFPNYGHELISTKEFVDSLK